MWSCLRKIRSSALKSWSGECEWLMRGTDKGVILGLNNQGSLKRLCFKDEIVETCLAIDARYVRRDMEAADQELTAGVMQCS